MADDAIEEPHGDHGTTPGLHHDAEKTCIQKDAARTPTIAKPDMAKSSWLSSLTNHGSKPPFMLKARSSDAFIIGTVSLAAFTVSFHVRYSHCKDKKLIQEGHVPVWRHRACHTIRNTLA
jgi:hypothetical protein